MYTHICIMYRPPLLKTVVHIGIMRHHRIYERKPTHTQTHTRTHTHTHTCMHAIGSGSRNNYEAFAQSGQAR